MPRLITATLILMLTFIGTGAFNPSASAAPPTGQYIVVFRDDVANPADVARELGKAHGLTTRHVYGHALKGFAADIPEAAVTGIEHDPRVAFVDLDRQVQVTGQTLPKGVDRIDADRNALAAIDGNDTRVDVDVAVLDTGVDAAH